MFKNISRQITAFLYYGIKPDMPFVESQKIYVFNLFMLVVFPLQISYSIYHLLAGHFGLFLINAFQFAFFLTGYLTIVKPGFKFIRSLILFLSSLITIFSAIKNDNGIEFILLPVLLGALIVYDSVWMFVVHTLISFAAIVFVKAKQAHTTSFAGFFVAQHVNFIVSILMLIFFLIAFKRFYLIQQQKIEESNRLLKLRSAELENTNKELERFMFVASHDLQEPLRSVTSFLQLFEKKYTAIVDGTGKRYIHFAIEGSNRMKQLIEDLLQYSVAGAAPLAVEQVDMNEIVKGVLSSSGADLDKHEVSVTTANLPVVKAAKTGMTALLQNLVSNAIKYRRTVGAEIIIQGGETTTEWIMSVKDNGIGIEEQYFEKIFIVFKRLHNSDAYSGTGIGLSICKKIVERHGGKIWVESSPGTGSCFKFSIPKNKV